MREKNIPNQKIQNKNPNWWDNEIFHYFFEKRKIWILKKFKCLVMKDKLNEMKVYNNINQKVDVVEDGEYGII